MGKAFCLFVFSTLCCIMCFLASGLWTSPSPPVPYLFSCIVPCLYCPPCYYPLPSHLPVSPASSVPPFTPFPACAPSDAALFCFFFFSLSLFPRGAASLSFPPSHVSPTLQNSCVFFSLVIAPSPRPAVRPVSPPQPRIQYTHVPRVPSPSRSPSARFFSPSSSGYPFSSFCFSSVYLH